MPEQLERYLRRAEGELRRQLIASFSILFFTPSSYHSTRLFPDCVRRITFEDAASALESQQDLRSRYRASLLTRALPIRTPAARDAYVAATDPYIKKWWDSVYVMLERDFPGFFIHKTRYPRSTYFAPETPGQARYLRIDFKGHKGEVDLAFKNISELALREQVSKMDDLPGQIVSNGKSTAIQIAGLDPFVISDGAGIIETKVREAYQATYVLLTFWQKHQSAFDLLAPTGGGL